MEPNLITLQNIGNGAAEELFQAALSAALENIDDPNTDPKAKRAVTLVFTFKTDEDRRAGYVEIACGTKLAGIRPVSTRVFIGRHEGMLAAAQAPRQEEMFPQPKGKPEIVTAPAVQEA